MCMLFFASYGMNGFSQPCISSSHSVLVYIVQFFSKQTNQITKTQYKTVKTSQRKNITGFRKFSLNVRHIKRRISQISSNSNCMFFMIRIYLLCQCIAFLKINILQLLQDQKHNCNRYARLLMSLSQLRLSQLSQEVNVLLHLEDYDSLLALFSN